MSARSSKLPRGRRSVPPGGAGGSSSSSAPPPHDTVIDGNFVDDEAKARALARLGTVIAGGYRLDAVLGAGSAGAVFEAHHAQTGEQVAIKILHPELRCSPEHEARFMREARTASAIGHPNIVRILDAGRDPDGTLYQVLELLRGRVLYDAIEKRDLTTAQIVGIGRDVLAALEAAHARGIVHRDVKPENIFLAQQEGGSVRVKLLDFGIAKYFKRTDVASTFSTLQGVTLGTPHYMSPEACKGDPVSPRSDVWSAGAVLYHAFAGEPPFDAESIGLLLTKIVIGPTPSVGKLRPDLPVGLIETIDRALQQDPTRRWPTARQMSAALSIGGATVADLDWDD